MRERNVDIRTRDGSMTCFVVHPDEGTPLPIVIIYMDAFGIREELRHMGRRFATVGYYVRGGSDGVGAVQTGGESPEVSAERRLALVQCCGGQAQGLSGAVCGTFGGAREHFTAGYLGARTQPQP